MTKSDLKGFKISDQVKQPVDRARPKKEEAAAPPPSVGFPRIEALVESGDLGGLAGRLEALRELAKSGSNKDKLAAKKAAGAYERAQALLSYLLETKARLAQPQP
jgi:hypothetical protein